MKTFCATGALFSAAFSSSLCLSAPAASRSAPGRLRRATHSCDTVSSETATPASGNSVVTTPAKRRSPRKASTPTAAASALAAPAVIDYNKTHPTQQVKLDYQEPSATFSVVGSVLLSLLPVLLIAGFFFYMMRQAQGTNNQALSFGKSRARMFIGNQPTVTFEDVAGVDEAKQEVTEVVEVLTYPEKISTLGARFPHVVVSRSRRAAGDDCADLKKSARKPLTQLGSSL